MLVLPLGVTLPSPPELEIDQFALLPENVSFTCSPTPTVKRDRFEGWVANVCEVMVGFGVGDGAGVGFGCGPPGCGACVNGCTPVFPGLFTTFEKGTGAPEFAGPRPTSCVLLTSCAGSTRT